MSAPLTRRDFLTYGGSIAAGITLGELGRRHLARADALADQPRAHRERWTTTVCRDCAAACGVRVRLVDDTPVKLEGNTDCPIGRGTLCAAGQAAIEGYFDPDRLVGPARRAGARGENRWTRISWEEATSVLAAQLRNPEGSPEIRPVALAAESHGPIADAWTTFWTACGGRVAWTPAPTAARLRPAFHALTGLDRDPLFDLEHASYVLSFGAPIVETWLSAAWTQRSFGRFRRDASRARGRLVQVEVRRSLTARKADEWLPLAEGGQTVLAYGIASVILRESRADRRFLERFAGNLAQFEADVIRTYSPDDVSTLTGVPVVTVLRLARELTATPQPLVAVAADADRALVDAVLALNALIGALDRQGGISASPAPPATTVDDAAGALQDIVAGRVRPRVLGFADGSSLRAPRAPGDARAALGAAPFVVSFSPYLDETCTAADLLMPFHTPLEAWHAVRPAAAVPGEVLACTPPAVARRLDTRDSADALAGAARAIGGAVAATCRWKSAEDIVKAELDRVWKMRRGGPFTSVYETEWLLQLERGGWWTPPADSGQAFLDKALQAGGWIDPYFQRGEIDTALAGRGGVTLPLPGTVAAIAAMHGRLSERASGADVARADTSGDRQLPLRLVMFWPACAQASNPNQPVLYELLGQPEAIPWRPWIEIAPETAWVLGIDSGARVRVSSQHGEIDAIATIVQGMSPEVVAAAYVPSVPGGGRWAREIRRDLRTLWGPAGASTEVRVRVART